MGISTHILDTTRGRPASGVDVVLERFAAASGWSEIGRGATDADGRVKALRAESPEPGRYRITFQVDGYFRAQGVSAFYPEVAITFEVQRGGEHFHVPLLLNPFGFTTYRGLVIREVRAVPLTTEAFAPFGEVVAAGIGAAAPANQGSAVRYDGAARLESARPAARPTLAVYRLTATSLPFEVRLLEKHPASTQTFLPMSCARFLVCVAPPAADGTPDVAGLLAFLCSPGQGINYRRGVWHHPIVALDAPAELAMLAWEDGSALDCTEHTLAGPVRVVE